MAGEAGEMVLSALATYSRMIKLSHTIFALPFALASGWMASSHVAVSLTQWALIVACMVTARSSAMGFNRLADVDIDRDNPRTASRELPSGQLSMFDAWLFTLGSAALFVLCAGLLGETTLWLSPIVLLVVWGYSLAKRFTMWCHAVLGVALGLAPTAVWIALTDSFGWTPALLSVAVGTWVAGFDIIYACQDAEFDAAEDLYSLPSRLGLSRALMVSRAFHVVTVAALAALPWVESLTWAYWPGWMLIAGVLFYEHTLVSPTDLSRIDRAFFDLNGYISMAFLLTVVLA